MQPTLIYTIVGDPVSIIKASHLGRKVMDPYNLRKMNYQQQLQKQHNEQPYITGAWALEAQFMFEAPCSKTTKPHAVAPTLTSLLRFVDELAHGIIYENDCILANINILKAYTMQEPKTILIFKRME